MYDDILRARLKTQQGFPQNKKLSRGLYGFFYHDNEYQSYETRYLKGPTNCIRTILYLLLFIFALLTFLFFVVPLAIIIVLISVPTFYKAKKHTN